ncbi:MAG: hypothetical protein AAGB48_13070, partial [Planctomycetota bacterium]
MKRLLFGGAILSAGIVSSAESQTFDPVSVNGYAVAYAYGGPGADLSQLTGPGSVTSTQGGASSTIFFNSLNMGSNLIGASGASSSADTSFRFTVASETSAVLTWDLGTSAFSAFFILSDQSSSTTLFDTTSGIDFTGSLEFILEPGTTYAFQQQVSLGGFQPSALSVTLAIPT